MNKEKGWCAVRTLHIAIAVIIHSFDRTIQRGGSKGAKRLVQSTEWIAMAIGNSDSLILLLIRTFEESLSRFAYSAQLDPTYSYKNYRLRYSLS